MTYRYPLPPSANKYWRLARGRLIVSDEAKQYKETVAMLARCDGIQRLSGPVVVRVAVYRERKIGDLDNFLKVLLDALQGIFYNNDAQIRELHATLDDDRHSPRVEVTVISCRDESAVKST